MSDPWSQPAPFKGTRFVCPFEDWYHDEPEDAVDEIPADVALGTTTLEEAMHAVVFAQLSAKYKRIDGLIRVHLESHTLEEWFAAAVTLQQIQYSAKVVTEVAPPPTKEIHNALCAGAISINTARWIQHASSLIDGLNEGAASHVVA